MVWRPLAWWDCGFESQRRLDVSLMNIVCCQVEFSATGWSLVQRSPTKCDVILPWPSSGRCAIKNFSLKVNLYGDIKSDTSLWRVLSLIVNRKFFSCFPDKRRPNAPPALHRRTPIWEFLHSMAVAGQMTAVTMKITESNRNHRGCGRRLSVKRGKKCSVHSYTPSTMGYWKINMRFSVSISLQLGW